MPFRPTQPAAGRLLRLGLMLDTRNAPARFREIARMGERAGVDALWVADPDGSAGACQRLEAWTGLAVAGLDTSSARIGAMLDVTLRPPELLAAMAKSLDAAIGGRLEIGLRGGREPFGPARVIEEYVSRLREVGADSALSLEASGPGGVALAARVADDLVVRGRRRPISSTRSAGRAPRARRRGATPTRSASRWSCRCRSAAPPPRRRRARGPT